jgi:hypothetical protein
MTGPALRLAIVGRLGGTHIGESLHHAAVAAGHAVTFFDADDAFGGGALARALAWRAGHRPVALERFSARVAETCVRERPDLLITTGAGNVSRRSLEAVRAAGVITANYSTDDPWNPSLAARWHQRALPAYDHIFTPRRANLDDFRRAGCASVRYLPFGYDERHAAPPDAATPRADLDVLFVGGADSDRVAFVRDMRRSGVAATLVGGYWDRYRDLRRRSLGMRTPDELRTLTAGAKVNLCLVRRANRDGHVMRSLEIGAIGGCTLAEDTAEHRLLFGPDGEAVVYFQGPADAAAKAEAMLADAAERRRLGAALLHRIAHGGHTYGDRLASIVAAAREREAKGADRQESV